LRFYIIKCTCWNNKRIFITVDARCKHEKKRLRVFFENRVLMRLFGSKKDEETGVLRRLLDEELNVCTHHPLLFG
jgi:hypothetical protein